MAKKKKRPVDDDEDDFVDDYDDDDNDYQEAQTKKRPRANDDEENPESPRPKVRSNAFTGMLAISLVALLAAAALFYLDFDAISGTIPQPSVTVPELGASVAPGR
ncbi:MAG: hypothetical protein LC104_17515 [Bacteroidales bacterium]|nr:hypothetical protein [Bacteroidales bacterium]